MSRKTMTLSVRSAISIAVMVVMSLAVIAMSNPLHRVMKGSITMDRPEVPFADGTYVYEIPEPDSKNCKNRTTITMSSGIIVPCVWDSFDAEGSGRQRLSTDGQYVMADNGPTWRVQTGSIGEYVIRHQKVEDLTNQEGYATGTISTASINVYSFINGVEECPRQAAE